jgi:type II secretory pathway pseudopilin PulG
MTLCNKKLQSGRSMIEMLGVLAIVGVLSAGGIAGYSMAMANYKATTLNEKVLAISQQARVLYEGVYNETASDDPKGVMGLRLIASGFVADVNNPFGGYLKTNPSSGDSSTFTIETDAVISREACIKIMTTNWGENGMISSITTDSGVLEKFPADGEDAMSVCDKDNLTVTWKMK